VRKLLEVDGGFYEWRYVDDRSDNVSVLRPKEKKCTVLSNYATFMAGEGRFELHLNEAFNTGRRPSWVRHVEVKMSSLIGDNVGVGVFAAKPFEIDETVGIYMGTKRNEPNTLTHEENKYVLTRMGDRSTDTFGIDGKGGIGSGFPVFMAMHLMNDPHHYTIPWNRNPNRSVRYNCRFKANGSVVAIRRIEIGEELFVDYAIS